ncbi:kinase-like domain-containing protein [Mycena albidolilacea]|uniref:Kinase-like domain-containing protein n=1 Tax=Mycena albidolilacea TaxID=1033008 RepID=A0AAD7A2X1_9AGAR|nr:kinase-like domain-containing protein [Mycena albidolilacea]
MPDLELATEIEHSTSEASAKRGADGDPSIVTEWIKGALIGTGSAGAVYLGMDGSTGLLMAVKQFERPADSAADQERKKSIVDTVEREIELAKNLRHKNILQYLSSLREAEHLNIFVEYVPGGSIAALLQNYGAFHEALTKTFVRQILEGLDYLHEHDIVHSNLKCTKILVDNKGGVKISTFGISKIGEDGTLSGDQAPGSVFWMAPEVVKRSGHTQKASNIWSLGCAIVEMLTAEHPWPTLTPMQAIFKIGSSNASPDIPSGISSEAQDFLRRAFELDPQARPSAKELPQHAWLCRKIIGGAGPKVK